jgi:hypothetical protein
MLPVAAKCSTQHPKYPDRENLLESNELIPNAGVHGEARKFPNGKY